MDLFVLINLDPSNQISSVHSNVHHPVGQNLDTHTLSESRRLLLESCIDRLDRVQTALQDLENRSL